MQHEFEKFTDDQGDSEASWKSLPPEREFFASPYDPPVKSLIQEIKDKELVVRPTFQRAFVWDAVRQSRFVESILLNIPVPNLFFAEDDDKTKVVVDGQQRLTALHHFQENRFPLKGLESLAALNGKRFEDLTERQQRIFNNRTLRCLVISARSDSEIRFQVFERLNQGGVPLNSQEVRHCVYRGSLNDLLHELVKDANWLSIMGKEESSPRMTDCELILRFLSFRERGKSYSPPLKGFLNSFMRDERHAVPEKIGVLRTAFESTVRKLNAVFGVDAFRSAARVGDELVWDRSLNRAVFDCQMLAFELVDEGWLAANAALVKNQFLALFDDEDFSDAVSRATADVSRLRTRLLKVVEMLERMGVTIDSKEIIPGAE